MSTTLTTATTFTDEALASFGSGNGSRAASSRAKGPTARNAAPRGAINSLRAAGRRHGATPGRGKAARRELAARIEAAAGGNRRLTNRQIAQFRAALRGA